MGAELSEKERAGDFIRQIGAIIPDGEEIALAPKGTVKCRELTPRPGEK